MISLKRGEKNYLLFMEHRLSNYAFKLVNSHFQLIWVVSTLNNQTHVENNTERGFSIRVHNIKV